MFGFSFVGHLLKIYPALLFFIHALNDALEEKLQLKVAAVVTINIFHNNYQRFYVRVPRVLFISLISINAAKHY